MPPAWTPCRTAHLRRLLLPQQFGHRRELLCRGRARWRCSTSTTITATAGRTSSMTADDVLTVSIHGHPSHAYPNFSGYSDERGEGGGLGFNHNFPTEPPVDDERYLGLLDKALGVVRAFKSALSRPVDRLRHYARRPDGIIRRHQPGNAAYRPAHRPFWPPHAHRAGRRLLARQPALRRPRFLPRHHRSLA